MADLTLSLFGPVSLRRADGADLTPASRKCLCLLAFLALQPGGRATRERLCGLLWSDRAEEQARGSLRQVLVELRRAWGVCAPGLLDARHSDVGLDLARISVDVLEAETLVERNAPADLLRAAGLWRGELLADVTAPDRSFDEWLLIERAHRGRRMARALHAGLDEAARRGMDDSVVALAEALLRQDPSSERATRAMMELDLRHGDAARALRRFTAYRETLAQELDVQPSPDLEALQARARRLAVARSERLPAPRRAVRRLPRLAVVFRPPTGPPRIAAELHALVEEELLLCLCRARELRVFARPDESEAGDADYVLFVSVAHDGRSGRANYRLTRHPEGHLMIGEQIGIPEMNAHEMVVAETGRVAFVVQHAIELQPAAVQFTPPDAYAMWRTGLDLFYTFQPDHFRSATSLFEQAVEADHSFAKPLAGLAAISLSLPMASPASGEQDDDIERGFQLAKRAVSLDPWDARARIILGWAHLRRRSPEFACTEFKAALALAPQDPGVLIACSEAFAYFGEVDSSLNAGQQAFRINSAPPDYYHHYMSIAYTASGNHHQALAHSRNVLATFPEQLAWQALILDRLNLPGDAASAAQTLLDEMSKKWSGAIPFHKSLVVDWLDRTILIPRQTDRAECVSAMRKLVG